MHRLIVGTVDGRGYDGQLKYTICDACRPCHSILSILKPVFSPNSTYSLCLQLAQVPRSPDLAIFVSTTTTMTTQPITLPLAHTCRVIIQVFARFNPCLYMYTHGSRTPYISLSLTLQCLYTYLCAST